jgi:hypothetical protein
VNGRPFSLVADSGFKAIVGPIASALNTSINVANLRDFVVDEANELRKQISNEVRGRLILMKLDGASRHDRSVLGINIQFIKDGSICLRTLALYEMQEKHTSDKQINVIMDVLKGYDISLRQIYSVTTDNGANMVKAVRLLMEQENVAEENNEIDSDSVIIDNVLDDIELEVEEEQEPSALATRSILRGVRCAAHTLQLAVDATP